MILSKIWIFDLIYFSEDDSGVASLCYIIECDLFSYFTLVDVLGFLANKVHLKIAEDNFNPDRGSLL